MTSVNLQNNLENNLKKAYIRPEVYVVALQTESVCQMLTGSTRVPEEVEFGEEFGEENDDTNG